MTPAIARRPSVVLPILPTTTVLQRCGLVVLLALAAFVVHARAPSVVQLERGGPDLGRSMLTVAGKWPGLLNADTVLPLHPYAAPHLVSTQVRGFALVALAAMMDA